MQKKLGFWSVFSLVVGSQVGSGIFVSPPLLAPYGAYSILGWALAGCMAVVFAVIFAKLCMHFPRTGGPHVYVYEAFGETASFFTGWAYWVVSWFSTPVVIIASVNYFSSIVPIQHPLYWQLGLLALITILNLKSVQLAGHVEFVLSLFKFIPFTVIPLIALWYFNKDNLEVSVVMKPHAFANMLMITLFSFLGLECATAPAEYVDKPEKTIPKAIVSGTICVAFIYILNSAGLLGFVPASTLAHSQAPYVDATNILFGNFSIVIGVIATIVCIGTLNAWVLTSSQIAYGLSKDQLFPAIFGIKNKEGTPYLSVLISSLLIVPLLILTAQQEISDQLAIIIDHSSIIILFVYAICSLALIRISNNRVLGLLGFVCCAVIIAFKPLQELMFGFILIILGLPVFMCMKGKK